MMMRRYTSRLLTVLALTLALPACSAVLDIDSLQSDEDGSITDMETPYDMSLGLLRLRPQRQERLALGGSVLFRWRALPGQPAASDLDITAAAGTRPLAQVFSRAGKPYLRLGLQLVPLRADRSYRLSFHQRGLELRDAAGRLLLRQQLSTAQRALLLSLDGAARRVDVMTTHAKAKAGRRVASR
jgi:hypothetical protein